MDRMGEPWLVKGRLAPGPRPFSRLHLREAHKLSNTLPRSPPSVHRTITLTTRPTHRNLSSLVSLFRVILGTLQGGRFLTSSKPVQHIRSHCPLRGRRQMLETTAVEFVHRTMSQMHLLYAFIQ
ncbi:hypothetical protein CGRA01v4_07264 [Colletotrichum graminicola]|nr:hypothetical protein CGRA01v4_07264 [Colletotrichum graminicola]